MEHTHTHGSDWVKTKHGIYIKHRKTKGERHIAITITITNSSSSKDRNESISDKCLSHIYTRAYMHVLQENRLSVLATQKRRNWYTFPQNGIVFLFCSDYFLLQCLRFESFQRNFLVFLLIILAFFVFVLFLVLQTHTCRLTVLAYRLGGWLLAFNCCQRCF